jgi:hypothetical protein
VKAWEKTWLAAYEECGTVVGACKVAKISRQTAYNYRRDNEGFAAAWDKLETAVTELLEKTAVQRALDGSDRLMEFMLKARRPGTYRESVKMEHSGKVNVEVEEGVNDAISGYLAEIERLTERLADLAPDGQAAVPGGAAG